MPWVGTKTTAPKGSSLPDDRPEQTIPTFQNPQYLSIYPGTIILQSPFVKPLLTFF